MKYSASSIKPLLEDGFRNDLIDKTYVSKTINAKDFLTHVRFDLAFKLLYLEIRDKDIATARRVYKEHIRAFSLGKFTEPGNEKKNSIEKFFEEFDSIFENIRINDFDSKNTLIPLSKNGLIANGAHRIASAIFLNKNVECVDIGTYDQTYDYKFFYNRNVPRQDLDAAATKFVEYSDNTYIAFIWPTAQGYDKKIEKIIPNIVYRKDIVLNFNGAHNLLSQIYYGEDWLGTAKNNFIGAQVKVMECFKTFRPVRIVAFQSESLNEVFKIKEKIRNVFNVGKHSIHITDTKEEAVRVARVVFNDNGVHFLNYAKPNKHLSFHKKMDKYKKLLVENKINQDSAIFGGDATLSVYGIREVPSDCILLNNSNKLSSIDGISDCFDDELECYDKKKSELIYNPKNYFYFNDVKFISFDQLYKSKQNKQNKEDAKDFEIMSALLKSNQYKKTINQWKQKLYYGRAKLRQKAINLLKAIGLFDFVKKTIKNRQ